MPGCETNTAAVIRRLLADGWELVGGGSHDKYRHACKPGLIMVPRHRTLTPGVARSIHKAAGWSVN